MGIEDIFDGPLEPVVETPQTPVAEPETPPVVAAEPAQEQPPVVEPPVIEEPQPDKSVPLATFLDMRDKVKAAEHRLAEIEAARPQEQPAAPDPYDDPQGYAAHNQQQVQQAVLANKFEMSDVIAKQTHGAETVDAATAWANARAKENPGFVAEYMRQAHPIDWIVRQHKRDGLLSQIGDDPDEYVRRRAAELGLSAPMAPAAVVAAPTQAPVTPPRSLASSPSVNGGVKDIPTGPLSALEAVFNP